MKRVNTTGNRKQLTTASDDRLLKLMSPRNRRKTSPVLQNEFYMCGVKELSSPTVRRRLFNIGLRGWKTKKKSRL